MKKVISFLVAMIAIICYSAPAYSQNRTEVSKGVYVVTYGNVTVIENDNTQQTVKIAVQKKSDSVYNILCNDTVVKTVTKAGITEGITAAIMAYTTIPRWVTRAVVGRIVDKAYEGVCEYYK